MNVALVMDVDGTLTPPRRPLEPEMANVLGCLTVPFHVAAGSDLPLVEAQFLQPLHDFGFRGAFDAFLSNGAMHYKCRYDPVLAIELVNHFDFRQDLGEQAYQDLCGCLERVLADGHFRLPPNVAVIGPTMTFRRSMLNFSPIGRPVGALSPGAFANREAFVAFDQATGYRLSLLKALKAALEPLSREKKLRIMLGGQTSFDILIEGMDKTYALRTLLARGVRRIVFIGDALFEGGNDSVVMRFVSEWKGPGPCPVETVQVSSWQETLAFLQRYEAQAAAVASTTGEPS